MSASGLLLPPGIVQPFNLHAVHDDLHVMAFFENHPAYEAVEAMIRRSGSGRPAIRAVLTRHDQSQIDHVNDEGLFAAARFAQRQTCMREIVLGEHLCGDCPRVRVEFVSCDGEPVVLDVTSVSPPERSRGGLTDPGRHAEGMSLPLMWRGKSAFAGPASHVTIAGIARPIPVRLGGGAGFVALLGFFTESHDMLILRAGSVASRLLERPAEWKVGARWTYEGPEGERSYRITALAPEGGVRLSRTQGPAETLLGRCAGEQLELHRVDVLAAAAGARFASLVFEAPRRFAMRSEGGQGSVEGEVARDADGGIHLLSRQPAWATRRAAHLRITQSNDCIDVTTSIG
jgi:hypothetical protein